MVLESDRNKKGFDFRDLRDRPSSPTLRFGKMSIKRREKKVTRQAR
jgi:hypothetical protein